MTNKTRISHCKNCGKSIINLIVLGNDWNVWIWFYSYYGGKQNHTRA